VEIFSFCREKPLKSQIFARDERLFLVVDWLQTSPRKTHGRKLIGEVLMKLKTNEIAESLHQQALHICRHIRQSEFQLIEVLQKIDASKAFKHFGSASLFQYATSYLDLTGAQAYGYISVARKSREVSELGLAIKDQRLSVSKVSRMVAALNKENATSLIEFAQKHTAREIDFEVARINPKAPSRESARAAAGDRVNLKLSISKEVYDVLKRAQLLAGQTDQRASRLEGLFEILAREYLKRKDPVQKAQRAVEKKRGPKSPMVKELCTYRVPAAEKHEAVGRDGGRCTFHDSLGKRCTNERWLHLHHIKPRHQGGGNESENLTTLCSAHHDLVHQLNLPLGD
jgi:hypothetical protein